MSAMRSDATLPDDATVDALVRFAGLGELAPERTAGLAEWLRGLMPEIADTSARMAAQREIPPASVSGQPPLGLGRERA
jgi:hypothetical protein